MRRMIDEGDAMRPNPQIINAVAAKEAGALINLTAARQMMNRQRRRLHPVLPRTPALAAADIVNAEKLGGTTPSTRMLQMRYVPSLIVNRKTRQRPKSRARSRQRPSSMRS